jgi:hypothetical protein
MGDHALVCVDDHAAQLPHAEGAAALADPILKIERFSAITHDRKRKQRDQRCHEWHGQQNQSHIQRPFQPVAIDALVAIAGVFIPVANFDAAGQFSIRLEVSIGQGGLAPVSPDTQAVAV